MRIKYQSDKPGAFAQYIIMCIKIQTNVILFIYFFTLTLFLYFCRLYTKTIRFITPRKFIPIFPRYCLMTFYFVTQSLLVLTLVSFLGPTRVRTVRINKTIYFFFLLMMRGWFCLIFSINCDLFFLIIIIVSWLLLFLFFMRKIRLLIYLQFLKMKNLKLFYFFMKENVCSWSNIMLMNEINRKMIF